MDQEDKIDIALIKRDVAELHEIVSKHEKTLSTMSGAANKVAGGVIVLMAIGSIAAWGANLIEAIKKWFH